MWDGTQKPIEQIRPDDTVVSYDENGNLVPGRVTRTFQNRARHILDLHGLMMTPGHVTYCARVEGEDNPFAGRHVPVLDILRSDGALMKKDGSRVRAATGAPVGSDEDRSIPAIVVEDPANGGGKVMERGTVRLGTTFMAPEGRTPNEFATRSERDYNNDRPHSAIGNKPPISLMKGSSAAAAA